MLVPSEVKVHTKRDTTGTVPWTATCQPPLLSTSGRIRKQHTRLPGFPFRLEV